MRSKEFLIELGNNPYEYTLSEPNVFTAYTKVGTLFVSLYEFFDAIYIAFDLDGELELTKLGDQWRILSTVKNIISKELPKLLKPNVISIKFTGTNDEESRISLYNTKVVPFIKSILGDKWTVSITTGPMETMYDFDRKTETK